MDAATCCAGDAIKDVRRLFGRTADGRWLGGTTDKRRELGGVNGGADGSCMRRSNPTIGLLIARLGVECFTAGAGRNATGACRVGIGPKVTMGAGRNVAVCLVGIAPNVFSG